MGAARPAGEGVGSDPAVTPSIPAALSASLAQGTFSPSLPHDRGSLLRHPLTEGALGAPLTGSDPSKVPVSSRSRWSSARSRSCRGRAALPCNAVLARRDRSARLQRGRTGADPGGWS